MHTGTGEAISCDKEQIHIPGKIQNHGYLIALDRKDFTIKNISENIADISGYTIAEIIGFPINKLLEEGNIELQASLLAQLKEFSVSETDDKMVPSNVYIKNVLYFLLAHKNANVIILEFEVANNNTDTELERIIGISVSQILQETSLTNSLQAAIKKVKQLTGYERIMIYKFGDDGHGKVIAEEKDDHLEPFMGLHFPDTDIPKQARELYKLNLVRIIADTTSVPVNIAGSRNSNAPLDLTHSTLRAVSPVHIEYLNNMDVKASFSVSLIVNHQLWGLIACHNSTPRFIDFKARESANLIGQILSSSIEYKASRENKNEAKIYNTAIAEMLKLLQIKDSIPEALTGIANNLLHITSADGAAVVFDKKIYTLGKTPSAIEIEALVDWLKNNNRPQIYYTDALPGYYKPAEKFADTCSGLLACALSKEMGEYLLWFKPEIIKTVQWAGNPKKQLVADSNNGEVKISPRKSFAAWAEKVRGYSEPWNHTELTAALKLREYIVQTINLKTNQLRLLNEKLQEAYNELDTFSFTISHDLKTPLASIKNYTEILLEDNIDFNEDVTNILKRIVKGAEKMNLLINEVLAYSKIGLKQVLKETIDMQQLIDDIVNELSVAYNNTKPKIIIKNTPPISGDLIMINQVFTNILSNAFKYSSKNNEPSITVDGENLAHEVIYKISDNGVGIDMSFGNQIFEIFKRLNNVKSFEGSGVGLSIVKRIIEKHQAKIWYESELGIGTVFYLSFSK